MSRWAGIKDGTVKTVAVSGTEPPLGPLDAWVPLPGGSPVGPGWSYDGSTFTPPPPRPPRTVVPRDTLLDRFTDNELAEIAHWRRFRQKPDGSPVPYAQWRALEVAQWRIEAADRVRLDAPAVVQYINGLETVGILAAGRAAEILAPE